MKTTEQRQLSKMRIKDYLHKVKANKYTYNNLDNMLKIHFQLRYNNLKKHQEKEVKNIFYYLDSMEEFNLKINLLLSNENQTDYLKKYEVMKILSEAIKY